MISPQFKIEDALAAILAPISGLNVFTSNRRGARLFPFVTIQASLGAQQIIPYSGVFEVGVDIAYSNSATLISNGRRALACFPELMLPAEYLPRGCI